MAYLSKGCILALIVFCEFAAAGPKYPRAGKFTPRAVTNSSTVSLHILTETGVRNETAPDLYGWMFEDINHSGDGGLYGELLTNRAFDGSDVSFGAQSGFPGNNIIYQENNCNPIAPVITGYKPLGSARIRLDNFRPLSPSHQTALALDIPTTANTSTTPVGFANVGWWGIPVSPQTYNVSFFIYPNQFRNQYNPSTEITVSLQSNITGEIWASTIIPAQSWNLVNYTFVSAQIVSTITAPDVNNSLAITFDPVAAAGQTYFFDQVSLFGETFKGYKNGLRKDLAQHISDLGPRFLRWPGGNNLEGASIQRRWKWWETIGPLEQRWSRPGNWLYQNTNGLGLLEFLEWSEAMGMENVLDIYAGYSLGDLNQNDADEYPGTAAAMYPLLKEALDELEFITGSTETYWGAQRAEYGHPEPFKIKYIEIGNEDWFSKGYPFRFKYLYDGLKAAYPDIIYISSAYDENPAYTVDLPPGSMWDIHHYEEPQYFVRQFDYFDNWQEETGNPDVTVMIGEYAVYQVDTPDGQVDWSGDSPQLHVAYPRMVSALSEGVYILGAERNPHVVKLSCSAPSLQNWNWYNWTPNMIAFDADPSHTVLSTSYYLQKLFNAHRGAESVEVTNSAGDFNPLFWASSAEEGRVFLKVININSTAVPLSVDLETSWSFVNGTILSSGDPNGYNYKNNATAIIPLPLNLTSVTPAENGSWTWNVPAYSVTVLQFNLGGD